MVAPFVEPGHEYRGHRFGSLQAPFHLARTELEWARMLSERSEPGDRVRARELLEHARSTAGQYGCAQVQRRAERLLEMLADEG